MPTYFATGVTGTLSICELRDAVSNVIDFQCHPEQHSDAERMKKAIDRATPLSERLVGGDGAANSIVQYLGAQADMPMKMVVARAKDLTQQMWMRRSTQAKLNLLLMRCQVLALALHSPPSVQHPHPLNSASTRLL